MVFLDKTQSTQIETYSISTEELQIRHVQRATTTEVELEGIACQKKPFFIAKQVKKTTPNDVSNSKIPQVTDFLDHTNNQGDEFKRKSSVQKEERSKSDRGSRIDKEEEFNPIPTEPAHIALADLPSQSHSDHEPKTSRYPLFLKDQSKTSLDRLLKRLTA